MPPRSAPWATQPARIAAGGPDQMCRREAFRPIASVAICAAASTAVDFVDQARISTVLLGPERGGPNLDPFKWLFLRQIFFRQGRAFIGNFRLAADHGDAPAKPFCRKAIAACAPPWPAPTIILLHSSLSFPIACCSPPTASDQIAS